MDSEEKVRELFVACGAVWLFNYDGDLRAPHAELTGGLCSDGYFNLRVVLADPQNVQWLAVQLVKAAVARNVKYPDWVVGSPYAAIVFSYEVARLMGAKHGFAQKDPQDNKKMVWVGPTLPEGSAVLQCEELITTGGTAARVREAIAGGNPNEVRFLPDILTIVHRPELIMGKDVVAITTLVRRQVRIWDRKVCPLCAARSPRIPPSKNWTQLTGGR